MAGSMFSYSTLIQAVVTGNHTKSVELVSEALREGVRPQDIVSSGLQAGMRIVGDKFSAGDFFVPEMLLAARAVTRATEVLQPLLSAVDMPTLGRVVIGTVFGDIHDIGKNLVTMLLRGAGFEVFDLGVNIPADNFVRAVKEHNPDILGMSALLTTTMSSMSNIIKALEIAGLRSRVKVIVGGAPVTQHFAEHIGADGYSANGGSAIKLCRHLVGK
jgi:5-methyltetrahydrofolate--homocysteine methyltransferase